MGDLYDCEFDSAAKQLKRAQIEFATLRAENERLRAENAKWQTADSAAVKDALAQVDDLDIRNERLVVEVANLQAARIVTCVYCGHAYPDGTPRSQDERLTAHIRVCEKHPMRVLEAEVAKLRAKDDTLRSALCRIMSNGMPVHLAEAIAAALEGKERPRL